MSANIQQKNYYLQCHSDLGSNDLRLIKIDGHAALSELFHYKLEFISMTAIKDPIKLIGSKISFSITAANDQQQYYHGCITRFSNSAFKSKQGFYHYYADVRPWFWFLDQNSDCHIYPDEGDRNPISIIDVIKTIFKKLGLKNKTDYDLSQIKSDYPKKDFWVQYNESSFMFISRLLEEYGIFYYFAYDKNKHILILSDSKNAYQKSSIQKLNHLSDDSNSGMPHISSWDHDYQFCSGKWSLNNHNFEIPKNRLLGSSNSLLSIKNSKAYEHYRYTDYFQQRSEAEQLSLKRMQALEAQHDTVQAKSNEVRLAVGQCFEIDLANTQNYFPAESNSKYVVTAMALHAEDNSYPIQSIKPNQYHNEFTCIPASVVYRPLLKTPKPVMHGVHEAIITGPQGKEIHTDKYSRMKIQFFWDRTGKNDANSSCWVRSIQHWEGLYRVGTPVLVGFINDDIDQPIILGPVDDAKQMPLYALEKNLTQSGIKRRPGANGNDKNYNEIRFEDKGGSEQFYMYAGKDMQEKVENDKTVGIKKNRNVTIEEGSDKLVLNKGDLTISVEKGKYVLTVKGDIAIKSDGNIDIKSGKAMSLQAGTDFTVKAAKGTIDMSGPLNVKAATIKLN